jgi:glycosyltransferase involved in cell wall biosynthesis
VTKFLANSKHTAARIARCYGREAEVVHPPVRTDYFTIDESVPREDWLLVVAALEPYKRTDLVIEAASRAGFALKVVGTGSQANVLSEMAGPHVEMLGRVGDEALRDLYRRAKALVFPQVEDFGIIPVEAQACGCPVIACAKGGALETVTEDTGVFFEDQSADAIIEAAKALESRSIDTQICRANAERFSERAFDEAMLACVRAMLGKAGQSMPGVAHGTTARPETGSCP